MIVVLGPGVDILKSINHKNRILVIMTQNYFPLSLGDLKFKEWL